MPIDLQREDLPLPNVYFVSVQSLSGETHHLYVPADFSGSAFRKAQNLCAARHHFRPYRSNSVVKMRRLKLSDCLENAAAITEALATAYELGERDMIDALLARKKAIDALSGHINHDEVVARLREQLWAMDATAPEDEDDRRSA